MMQLDESGQSTTKRKSSESTDITAVVPEFFSEFTCGSRVLEGKLWIVPDFLSESYEWFCSSWRSVMNRFWVLKWKLCVVPELLRESSQRTVPDFLSESYEWSQSYWRIVVSISKVLKWKLWIVPLFFRERCELFHTVLYERPRRLRKEQYI